MAEAAGIVCEVDTPFANALVRALERVREHDDMGAVIAWLRAYRSDELRVGELLAERAERFAKVNNAFASFYLSYRISRASRASGAAGEYLRGMETALAKIVAIDEGMTENADELWALFRSSELDALSQRLAALASADGETAATGYLQGYERRLADNVFLTEELNRVLAAEYNARVEGARARVGGLAGRLAAGSEHLHGQIAGIDGDIDDLSRDENVSADDKSVLLRSFVRRRSELSKSLAALEGNALVMGALLAEYRSVTARLSGFLASVRGQLLRHTARGGYLRRLRAAGSEPPHLEEILDDARDSLLSNAEVLEEGFMLLDEAFQDELLAAIDSDRMIGSVTVRLKEVPGVAFALCPGPSSEAPPARLGAADFAVIDAPRETKGARTRHDSRRSIRPAGRPDPGPQ